MRADHVRKNRSRKMNHIFLKVKIEKPDITYSI